MPTLPNGAIYHSGKNSSAYAGSTTANTKLDLISWSVRPSQTQVLFQTSATGSYSYREGTFYDCEVDIHLEWNFSANPFLGANGGLTLTGGGTVAVNLYLNGTSGAFWSFPQVELVSNPQSATIPGKIVTSVRGFAQGAWVEPDTSP